MRRIFAGLFFALFAVCLLPGQTSSTEWEIPRDTLAEAVIGVAEFSYTAGRRPSVSQSFLGVSIARLLREKLHEIKTHEIDGWERGEYAMSIIFAERETIRKKLNELLASRDALYFSGISVRDEQKRKTLTEEIEPLRERLRILETLDHETIEIIPEKKLTLLATAADEGLLPPVMEPQSAAAKARVDYLLWGTVHEEAAGLLSLTVSLYAARSRQTLFSGAATGSPDELDSLVDRLFFRMAASLAGRPWASLDITAQPPDAYIYVNGELTGIGGARLAYVRPGSYHLSFHADGYELLEVDVALEPESRQTVNYRLTPADQPAVFLETFPPGADVYFGALKKGVSPFVLPLGATPDILFINLEGYKSKVLPSTSQELSSVHTLPRDIVSWDDRIAAKRADFYRSLGFLILSVPIPVMLYGAYRNEAFGYIQFTGQPGFDYDKAVDMERQYKIMYYAYFGSLFLSGSLLVNTVQKLMDYIRVGEESQKYPEGIKRKKEVSQ
ncbi:MAG: PEGA domain-containing protein [Spirochaetales bacterium]|jgi:hypothetical protein|nr:PEGA domain-containing protein [Spirochaetales bacterium]